MKVDYGLDAPGVVRGFAIAGAVLALVTIVVVVAGLPVAPELFGLGAVMFLAAVVAMIHSSRRGKLLERDRLLDGLRLGGVHLTRTLRNLNIVVARVVKPSSSGYAEIVQRLSDALE